MRKPETIRKQIAKYEAKAVERIRLGRLRGGSAGAFNRDLDCISHKIRLLKQELKAAENEN